MRIPPLALVLITTLLLNGCGDKTSDKAALSGSVSINRVDLQDMTLTLTNTNNTALVSVSGAFSGLSQVSLVAGSSTCQNVSAVNPLAGGASCTLTYESTTSNDPQSNTGSLIVNWSDTSGASGQQSFSATAATYLYVGGEFDTTYNGTPNALNNIAAWDGSNWHALGATANPGLDGSVQTLIVFNKMLYVGGGFDSTYNGTPQTLGGLAVWNGNAWSATGPANNPGFDGEVDALAVYNNALYAAGTFDTTSTGASNTLNGIATLNGTTWTELGGFNAGFDFAVSALGVANNLLYVGGFFDTTYNGTPGAYNGIATWNGISFAPVGSGPGLSSGVLGFATFNGNLYVGGEFTKITNGADHGLNHVTSWDGTNFNSLGTPNPGFNGGVRAFAAFNNTLYAAGNFSTAYNDNSNILHGIAALNGNTWSAVGSPPGFNNFVLTLAASPSLLYAGGEFQTTSGGTPNALNGIAAWNGSAWLPLGSPNPGLDSPVNALAIAPYLDIANNS